MMAHISLESQPCIFCCVDGLAESSVNAAIFLKDAALKSRIAALEGYSCSIMV